MDAQQNIYHNFLNINEDAIKKLLDMATSGPLQDGSNFKALYKNWNLQNAVSFLDQPSPPLASGFTLFNLLIGSQVGGAVESTVQYDNTDRIRFAPPGKDIITIYSVTPKTLHSGIDRYLLAYVFTRMVQNQTIKYLSPSTNSNDEALDELYYILDNTIKRFRLKEKKTSSPFPIMKSWSEFSQQETKRTCNPRNSDHDSIVQPSFANAAMNLWFIRQTNCRADATAYSNSLCYLVPLHYVYKSSRDAKLTRPFHFELEDYWMYEQLTGVNMAVEVTALLISAIENKQLRTGVKGELGDDDRIINALGLFYDIAASCPAIIYRINMVRNIIQQIILNLYIEKFHLPPIASVSYGDNTIITNGPNITSQSLESIQISNNFYEVLFVFSKYYHIPVELDCTDKHDVAQDMLSRTKALFQTLQELLPISRKPRHHQNATAYTPYIPDWTVPSSDDLEFLQKVNSFVKKSAKKLDILFVELQSAVKSVSDKKSVPKQLILFLNEAKSLFPLVPQSFELEHPYPIDAQSQKVYTWFAHLLRYRISPPTDSYPLPTDSYPNVFYQAVSSPYLDDFSRWFNTEEYSSIVSNAKTVTDANNLSAVWESTAQAYKELLACIQGPYNLSLEGSNAYDPQKTGALIFCNQAHQLVTDILEYTHPFCSPDSQEKHCDSRNKYEAIFIKVHKAIHQAIIRRFNSPFVFAEDITRRQNGIL